MYSEDTIINFDQLDQAVEFERQNLAKTEFLTKDVQKFEVGNIDKIVKMDFLSEEYIQENILSKAKQYDYLPIAFNNEAIQNQMKNEFKTSKLKS